MGKQSGNKNNKTNKGKSKNKSVKEKIIILVVVLCVLCVLLIGCVIFIVIKLNNKSTLYDDSDYSVPSEYYYEYPDVEEYFNENSKVLEVVPVEKSQDTFSEKDAIRFFEERGFSDCEITTSFLINGDYVDEYEISDSSSDKHPVYQTYYVTDDNMIWTVMVIDGMIFADSLSYNMEYADKVPVTVSESKDLISYDFTTNSFYRVIPNENVLKVYVVDRVDAETLETLTMEELSNG